MKTPLWQPPQSLIGNSNLTQYQAFLQETRSLEFANNEPLPQWSVDCVADFWESCWKFFDVKSRTAYASILQLPDRGMVGTSWFAGATLSYAEHVFRNSTGECPALVFQSETQELSELSWKTLTAQVRAVRHFLKQKGVQKGDRVAGYLTNTPEAVVAFLAANSLGAIWSCCSPDFGAESVLDRFQQIEPKVLFATARYQYGGKSFDKTGVIHQLANGLPSLKSVVWIEAIAPGESETSWTAIIRNEAPEPLQFEAVPFEHPIWILYSSGTTGKPKAIVHGTGGILLEHLKALALHQNVQPGDRYFWYSTTGWMMWNYALSSLLCGATLCLYDGAPNFPSLNILWDFGQAAQVNHFGGGAAFYVGCSKNQTLETMLGWPELTSIGSTGSPLPADGFRWIYERVKASVHLISISGGTDVCSAFVGGCPHLPVYEGEIQCRMLGADIEAWNDSGESVADEVGELIIKQPMPSMPVFFWNDANNQRYLSSYFEKYPDVWCHGDWVKITPNGGLIIYGRSDATLNRDGVRIGTAEVYSAVESLSEIKDSMVVCLDLPSGGFWMPLFVVMADNEEITDELKKKINQTLRQRYSPRHVPDDIIAVPDLPYTISGKKMEMPVKKILMGTPPDQAASLDATRNPDALYFFVKEAKAH